MKSNTAKRKLRVEEMKRSIDDLKNQVASHLETLAAHGGKGRTRRILEEKTRGTLLEGTILERGGEVNFSRAEERYLALPPAWLKLVTKLLHNLIAELSTLEKETILPQQSAMPVSPRGINALTVVGLERVISQGVVSGFETELVIRGSHTAKPVSISASALKNKVGEVHGAVIVAQDLSEVRRIQQKHIEKIEIEKRKLKDEKAKLLKLNIQSDAIFDSIGEGLIMTDVHGRIIRINPAALSILKIKQENIINEWVIKAIPVFSEDGELLKADERPVIRAVETGKAASEIVWLDRSRGVRFPVQMTATPLMLQKKPIGVIIVFRDITREREIDKAKTEFVSLASHQLRTPLSSINWYTEMLIAGDVGKMNADQTSYLKEIYNGNQRMVELVNALLNVSRIELGTFMVEPEPTDIVALSKDVVKGLEPKIFERKLDVKELYGEDIPKISVDPKLMRMVIENLVSNAVKYTEKEGSIIVSTVKKGKEILISVKDTGLGIPENQQDKIFSKLFRADNVRESDTTGTGLGLYLVRSIVEHSGGKVWFTSVESKGTTFSVSLPIEGMKARKGSKRLDQ